MTFHSVVPAPRTILTGVRKLPPATVRVVEPDGATRDTVYWTPEFTRDPAAATGPPATGRRRSWRSCGSPSTGGWSPTCPSGCCSPAASTPASSWRCWPRPGQTGLSTFSIGFESAGGESGDEFEYSTLVAERFGTRHHRIRIDSDRLPARPSTPPSPR